MVPDLAVGIALCRFDAWSILLTMALWQRRRRDSGTATDPTPDTPTGTRSSTGRSTASDTLVEAPATAQESPEPTEPTEPTEPAEPAEPAEPTEPTEPAEPVGPRGWRDAAPLTLLQAAHPRQGLATAVAMAAAAAAAGRPAREAAVVGATVLVGQTILGWHNDLVDRDRDAEHRVAGKPVAAGRIDPGTVWYSLAIAVLVVVPLSISTGITAGAFYLVSLLLGVLGNVSLRTGLLSFVPWAASFALYPFYLSHGGWGGDATGAPPEVVMVVLAALLGVGVHLLRSIWGLVADDKEGWTYLPLRLGRRLGATKLLVVAASYTGIVVALILIVGSTRGLRA